MTAIALNARARISVRDAIRACTRCPLHRSCTAPVPFHGPISATAAVLGEAPGKQEDKTGRPFVGPAGQLLRRLLSDAGIDPDSLAWFNTVSCFPNRTPTQREIDACSVNRRAQLDVLAPTHLLVAGGVALSTVRPDLKITVVHGRLFSDARGRWAYPVHHPSAALRNPQLIDVLAKDIRTWAAIITTDRPWDRIVLSCLVCGRLADRYDPDGIGWCDNHHTRGLRGWEKAARVRSPQQPELVQAIEDVVIQGAML